MKLTQKFKQDLQIRGEILFFLLLTISIVISLGGFTQMIVLSLYPIEGPLANRDNLAILAFIGVSVLVIISLLVLIAESLVNLKNYMFEKENNGNKN